MAFIFRYICSILALFLLLHISQAHAKSKMIAAVLTSDLVRYKEAHKAFIRTLAQKGYDQSNIEIITQTPNPDPISWANAIRKFNAIGADVIISYGAPVTLAAIRESDNIPVVFVDVYGPVETGITKSLTAPGKNFTGVSSKVPMITLIKAANEVKPIKNLGILYNAREIGSVVQLKEMKRVAAQIGFSVHEVNISLPNMLDNGVNTLLAQGVDFIYVSESSIVSRNIEKIITRGSEYKIPVISHVPEASEKGALVSLEVNAAEQGQSAGEYAAKILGGRKAGQLAIMTPKKVDLVVNLKTARMCDLRVPIQVLNLATKVVK